MEGFLSSSSEFFIAFGRNDEGRGPTVLKLLISSVEPGPVLVTVETLRGFNFSGFAPNNGTLEVVIPNMYHVFTSNERDKGIQVTAENQSKIVVYGVNYHNTTTDAFLALPCHRLPVTFYEYYGISYTDFSSEEYFLIVGCEDDTTVQIGSNVVQLNRMETYYWESYTITGRKVLSNKPLSVFVGARCAFVPTTHRACDHLTAQVPPTVTWGTKFLTASLAGRSSGDLYRIVASQASTTVNINCNTLTNSLIFNLVYSGSWKEFTTADMSYCSITSDKPLIVVQFALGYAFDSVGDPFMMIITPANQYRNNYILTALPEFSTNYITVYSNPEDFEPKKIFVDGDSLRYSIWNTICGSNAEISGYTTYVALTPGSHQIYHTNKSSHVGVSVYGFNNYNSYGYPGGFILDSVHSELTTEIMIFHVISYLFFQYPFCCFY